MLKYNGSLPKWDLVKFIIEDEFVIFHSFLWQIHARCRLLRWMKKLFNLVSGFTARFVLTHFWIWCILPHINYRHIYSTLPKPHMVEIFALGHINRTVTLFWLAWHSLSSLIKRSKVLDYRFLYNFSTHTKIEQWHQIQLIQSRITIFYSHFRSFLNFFLWERSLTFVLPNCIAWRNQ